MPADPTRPPAPLRRRTPPRPPTSPPPGPPETPPVGVWTDAKAEAVIASFRSAVANAAKKHGVPAHEVMALLRDWATDPG